MKTIYLYFFGDYQMKFENLTAIEADEIMDKWNKRPGWIAKEV